MYSNNYITNILSVSPWYKRIVREKERGSEREERERERERRRNNDQSE